MKETVSGKKKKPAVVILHGPNGVGKTHFGTTMPDPIFVTSEEIDDIESTRFPKAATWGIFLDQLKQVRDDRHSHQTLVLDSMDSFQGVFERKILKPGETMATALGGYGKSWQHMAEEFAKIRDKFLVPIRDRGMNILLICHTVKNQFDNPLTQDSYPVFETKMHRNSRGVGVATVFTEWVSAILFMSLDIYTKSKEGKVYAGGGGNRVVYTRPRPYFEAKNRYGLSDKIEIGAGDGWNKIGPQIDAFYGGAREAVENLYADAVESAERIPEEGPRLATLEKLKQIKDEPDRLAKALEFINSTLLPGTK